MNTRRRGMASYSGIVALSAYAGALGLAGGSIDTRGTIDRRLPLRSPVFVAVAPAVIVGIPNTAVAWRAWKGGGHVRSSAVVAGVMFVGWITVEIAFIRELSWLQPFYVVVGASLIWIGRRRPLRSPVR